MHRSTWITVTLCILLCGATYLWQRRGTAELQEKIASAELTRHSLTAGTESPDSRQRTKRRSGIMDGGTVSASAVPVLHEPHPITRFSAREFLRFVPDENRGPASLIRFLPELLGMLEDYSADELFALLAELNGMSDEKGKAETVAGLLLVILSGSEPERVLQYLASDSGKGNSGTVQEVAIGAFSALARKDATQASNYLEASGWSGRLRQQAQISLIRELARTDLLAALDYSGERQVDERQVTSVFASVARDPVVRERMAAVMGDISDEGTRTRLSTSLVGATYVDEGFEGVSEVLKTMSFPDPAARDAALEGALNMAMSSRPGATLDWVLQEASDARREMYVGNIIRSWAYQNFNEAAAWLDTQEPSPDRDSAIAAFATTVVGLDQEAAAVWAGQIGSEEVRATTQRQVFTEWNRRDPVAARAWMEAQGIDPEK